MSQKNPSIRISQFLAASLLAAVAFTDARAAIIDTDVCVYGGAAGGVTAAIQAKRMGKSVALLNFDNHLGGLSSSGLGQTDIGGYGTDYIQGLSREFYTKVGAKYGGGARFTFEPHVAEAVFEEMIAAANVPVYRNARLAGATMQGLRIQQITMDNGDVFRAKVFIDASYEGDLLKKAGVSYTTGREANAKYGETINGIQRSTSGHQFDKAVDAYVIPGNPASGLLPGVNPDPAAPNGSQDNLIQGYCYRMCLTKVAANRIAIAQPAGYNEADYEMLFRWIDAGHTSTAYFSTPIVGGSKTDSNNSGAVSTDLIGGNTNYIEADYATRRQVNQAHEKWQRGLLWTLQNHPRIPEDIRTANLEWGLPKDEFADNGHWPYQLYVREARRMVSDYVMTEKHCRGQVVAPDSIGLAAYTMDSHNTQRIAVNGKIRNEGDVQISVKGPYPVSYGAIVPKVGECTNLLVPWSLSASHVSFGSFRMEPVFMIIGQSAATAACFAIDDKVPVQQVSYPKLKAQLLADGQKLTTAAIESTGIVVDNSNPTGVDIVGNWMVSTATANYIGANYLQDLNELKGMKSVTFTPALPNAGSYEVFAQWTELNNRATNVPIDINTPAGVTTVIVNQTTNGGKWFSLGTYNFNAGSSATNGSVKIRTDGTDNYVIADAVRFLADGESPNNVSLWAANGSASEPVTGTGSAGKIMVSRSGPSTAALTVNLSISGSATNGTDYTALPASVTIPAGATTTSFTITPLADSLAEGPETIMISVIAGAGYVASSLDNATVTIADRPFDAWRRSHFSDSQLSQPDVSGDLADADYDGLNNLLEYLAARDPLVSEAGTFAVQGRFAVLGKTYLTLTFERVISSEIQCVPEVSGNLQSWTSGSAAIEQTILSDDGLTQMIRARDLIPDDAAVKRFIRLRVSRP